MYYQNGKTIADVACTFNTYGETTSEIATVRVTTTNPALPAESKAHTLYTDKEILSGIVF